VHDSVRTDCASLPAQQAVALKLVSDNAEPMKSRHVAAFALVGWYLMVPPSVREDSWFCSGGLLATVSHDLFGTGDQTVCEQWAKIADLTAPLSKWHEMGFFETPGACEEARDRYAMVPGTQAGECGAVFRDRRSAPRRARAAHNGSMSTRRRSHSTNLHAQCGKTEKDPLTINL
jgi:hypothetical protein